MTAHPTSSVPEAIPLDARRLSSPPAIWAAFARAGRWKSWALVLSFALNFFLVVGALGLAHRPPDVVLVDPTGKSTYVNRSIAGAALVRFLEEQRQQPSDVTVVHFVTEFLQTFLAVNSSTVSAAFPEALAMMDLPLRTRMAKQAAEQKLVESYQLAQVRTELTVENVDLVERHRDLLHVRATVLRRRSPLRDGASGAVDGASPISDRLRVTLVARIVPRTPARPDGLEIAEYANQLLPLDSALPADPR